MFIKEIDRTAVIAWGPAFQQQSFLATGTVSGALDASFSTSSELEIFNVSLQERESVGTKVTSVPCNARFNRLSWSPHEGIIAGGLEDGSVCLWSSGKLLDGQADSALIDSKSIYGGPVRGLSFSPHTPFLLAIGSVDAQLSLMDMHDTTKVYSPGPGKSQRLEDVTDLAWNPKVSHILAASSSNGITVVWDLRAEREALQFGVSGQRGAISSLSWNPELPNQMVCACEDNANPVIYSWDLRNAHSPDKQLNGHTKGVLSVAWCPKDSDLLLSSGKDNRTIFWNPRTASIIGELPVKDNWTFDVQWCPRNPDLLSTAGFDGKINIYSFQSVSSSLAGVATNVKEDLFGGAVLTNPPPNQPNSQSKQVPKWLKCPAGARFGFGGRLAVFGQESRKVAVRSLAENENLLDAAIKSKSIPEYCAKHIKQEPPDLKSGHEEAVIWTVLKILNQQDPDKELLRLAGVCTSLPSDNPSPLVSTPGILQPPSTVSTVMADAGSFRPSQEETPMGYSAAAHDFFSGSTDEFDILGSTLERERTKSPELARRSTFSGSPFSLYSSDASPHDQRITRAIIAGNFKEAVEQCISADKLSDALLVAVCGGPELVARTQRIYFQKVRSPYLRVVSGILKRDLSDVVENASLGDWQDLFGLVLSFSNSTEEKSKLLGLLADRLAVESDHKLAVPAIVCYLVAGDVVKACALLLKQSKESLPPSRNLASYSRWLSGLMDKVRVAQLTNEQIGLNMILEQLPELSKLTLHHSFLLAESGRFEESAFFLGLIASKLGQSNKVVSLFADRLSGLSKASALADLPRAFEVLNVQTVEPKRLIQQADHYQHKPVYGEQYGSHYSAAQLNTSQQTTTTGGPVYAFSPAQPHPQQQTTASQPYPRPVVSAVPPQPPSFPQPTNQPGHPPYPQASRAQNPYPQPTQNPYLQATSQPYLQTAPANPYQSVAQQAYDQPSVQQHSQPYQPPLQHFAYPQSSQPAAHPVSQQKSPAPMMTAAEFSARRTAEGFNDAPIVAPKVVPASRSPMTSPISAATGANVNAPAQHPMSQSAHFQPAQQPPKQLGTRFPFNQLGPPDPSKILPQHQPIYRSVCGLVQLCEQRATTVQKRSVDDANRRLQSLYSQLSYQALSDNVLGKLFGLCNNINAKDIDGALPAIQDLTTSNFAETGGWILGLRRLVELSKNF